MAVTAAGRPAGLRANPMKLVQEQQMVTESDLGLADGRTIHVYDTGAGDRDARLAVFWHHGTPNIGAPPSPCSRPR